MYIPYYNQHQYNLACLQLAYLPHAAIFLSIQIYK